MVASGDDEVEYESDPEEAKRLLNMRRREASDDEESSEGEGRERPPRRIDSRARIESDGELDGQGAPAEYDDEELEIEEQLEEYEEEEEEVVVGVIVEEEDYELRGGKGGEVVGEGTVTKELLDGEGGRSVGELKEVEGVTQRGEEKKENEPFAVPTAGAFYMHDDRFRDNAGGRHRRTLGGRKLWESKDDRKWGHDKFEEMTLQERHYEECTRNARGRNRDRGKNCGADREYPRGNRSKAYNNNAYINNNQSHGAKVVKGKGPRRYGPSQKNNYEAPVVKGKGPRRYDPSQKNNYEAPRAQHKQYGKSNEKTLNTTSGRAPTTTSNLEYDPVPARKQAFASSLNSASPPFYPSGSSNKEITMTQKRDIQAGTINQNQPAIVDEKFLLQSNPMMRGKNVVDSVGMEKLNINNSISPVAGKPSTSLQLSPSGSSFVPQPTQSRAQGRDLASSGQMTFQPGAPFNQLGRASPPTQLHTVQRSPVQTQAQPSLQVSVQQLGHYPRSGSQTPSPPKAALSKNSFEPGELESPLESSKSQTALVAKGKGSVQASGRGSFQYGGAQVVGASANMTSGRGDQNFAAAPAFLPVMPFGGQHHGGIGVPAVGMAFPGYVAQPQLGLGNSEMTWLPVLAGAAGALGASYCSPYISVDGTYHSRPSGQTSSSGASSKENNPNNEWKPSQRPEVVSDEIGQRQKNTRRYTEMHFGQ